MKEYKISDYSLIGNSRSAALVSMEGSIDWCCLPEFHSPSLFAKLLDTEAGGFFSITPVTSFRSRQKYVTDTNVLETYFESEEGKIRLLDAFIAMGEEEKQHSLFPEHEILRVVQGKSGSVRVRMIFSPRTFYGKDSPKLNNHKNLGINFSWKDQYYVLLTTLDPSNILLSENKNVAVAEFEVKEGDQIVFSLSYSNQGPAVLPEIKKTGYKRMLNTVEFWKIWISKCTYEGVYQEHVKRSALVLKLLTYAPSGAIIAAPTTSLPEKIGGSRNWDYRYCWLRDASFTVRALIEIGFEEEAEAYLNWILHATRLTRPRLQVVYTVFGNSSIKEKSIDWLQGYKNSLPVRIGNGADGQFQLDVYGEVLDAVYAYSPFIKSFDRDTKNFILGLGESICKLWDKPDNGIWEIRSNETHHTHSKVMAWVGLDRLIKLSEKYKWNKARIKRYREVASKIYEEVELLGYSEDLKSYTREYNGNDLDSSLLTLSLVNYCQPDSKRMVSTCEAIYDRLSKNNLVYRYVDINDGLESDEGCFGICNFWLAENFSKSGKLKKAVDVFEAILKNASPTGLFSEEIDPDSGELLGNFPQGFTHIGLINAALAINKAWQLEGNNK